LASRDTTRSFCIRDLEAWKAFVELCRKEGSSASAKLEEFIQQYVRDHNPGNPQTDLRIYSRPAAPKVVCPINCVTGVERYGFQDCRERRRYICRFAH